MEQKNDAGKIHKINMPSGVFNLKKEYCTSGTSVTANIKQASYTKNRSGSVSSLPCGFNCKERKGKTEITVTGVKARKNAKTENLFQTISQ